MSRMPRVMFSLWGAAFPDAINEPNQIVGLTATAVSSSQINLSWTADATAAPNTATSYVVERSIDGLGSWSTIAFGITGTTYSDTGLAASTTRYYRVSGQNSYGIGLASAAANATTQAGSLSPSWSIDWSSGTPSGYTLTRASSGTYVDSSGYIASASTNTARLTHNSSGSRLGLLVEGQGVNRTTYSEDFTQTTPWALNGLASVTANSGTAPDGNNNAFLLTESVSNTIHRIGGTTNISGLTAASPHTASVYVQKPASGGADYAHISLFYNSTVNSTCWTIVNLTNGNIETTDNGGHTNVSARTVSMGSGWYRLILTGTPPAGGSVGRIGVGTASQTAINYNVTSGNTKTVLAWGAQIENGSDASSYIVTTTASVTRSADLAHVLDSSITSWGDPGALVIHFYPPGQAGTLISTDDASTAQVGIEASSTTAARAFWSSGSTATGTIGSGVQKAVHYWNGSSSKFCINGGTVQSGTNNFNIANADFVTFGAEATDSAGAPGTFSQYANCVIRKVEFYSGTLTDANLQTITT